MKQLGQTGALPSKRVVGWHEYVVDKCEHHQPLFDGLPPLLVLLNQVTEIIVGNYDSLRHGCQPNDEAVIIANNLLVPDPPGRREDERLLQLQLTEDILVRDGVLCTCRLSAPLGDEHRDRLVTSASEPLHGQLDPFAGEEATISVSVAEEER